MERRKILVMGDGGHLFRTIQWVLEYKGYEVRLAPNPETALALLIESDYDLIIAKVHMEDLPSLDVLKRAKRLNPEVRIMVVSSDGNAAFPLEAYRIEVEDYLLVPLASSQLMRRVEQCLQKTAAAAAARSRINQELVSRIVIMLHDVRAGLVSAAASLTLLKRGKYGGIQAPAVNRLQELVDRLQGSTALIDGFSQEMLRNLGRHGLSALDNPTATGLTPEKL